MNAPNDGDKPLDLEQVSIDELDRTPVAGSQVENAADVDDLLLTGPHFHRHATQRELLRNDFGIAGK